jgi:hypothetical protein
MNLLKLSVPSNTTILPLTPRGILPLQACVNLHLDKQGIGSSSSTRADSHVASSQTTYAVLAIGPCPHAIFIMTFWQQRLQGSPPASLSLSPAACAASCVHESDEALHMSAAGTGQGTMNTWHLACSMIQCRPEGKRTRTQCRLLFFGWLMMH